MTLLVKIQSKTFSDEALHVCASVENDIGTHVGSYLLNLPEDASNEDIEKAIFAMFNV